jgi:hypothetical protein
VSVEEVLLAWELPPYGRARDGLQRTQSPPAKKRGIRSGNRGDERGRIVIGNSEKEVTNVGK